MEDKGLNGVYWRATRPGGGTKRSVQGMTDKGGWQEAEEESTGYASACPDLALVDLVDGFGHSCKLLRG